MVLVLGIWESNKGPKPVRTLVDNDDVCSERLGPISTQVSKVYTLLDKVRLSEFRRGRQEIAEGKYGQQKFLKSSQTSIMENKSSIHPPH